MKYLQIKVMKAYSVPVPEGTKTWEPGTVIWEGDAPAPRGSGGQAGVYSDGWVIVMGPGWDEVIPKGHLEINRFEYMRSYAGPVPWGELDGGEE